MNNPRKTSNGVRILHHRYVGEDVQRKASLEQERVNAEVARTIYELREQAGLSQKELAERVETTLGRCGLRRALVINAKPNCEGPQPASGSGDGTERSETRKEYKRRREHRRPGTGRGEGVP